MARSREIWKAIPGWEGFYEASNTGKIRSHDRYSPGKHGLIRRNGRELQPAPTSRGYLTVNLCKNAKQRAFLVHRLIGLTFLNRLSADQVINHKNGIQLDNRVENLEWCSQQENLRHGWDLIKKGRKK